MPYTKHTWTCDEPITTDRLNYMEEGIKNAHVDLDGIFNLIYPVGSIYMSATLSTPEAVAQLFGGTWEAWGQGRVPVGVGTADGKTFAANETGGAKDAIVVSHGHSVTGQMTQEGAHIHNITFESTYSDFIHSPNAVSSRQAKLDLDTSASYYYLRISDQGMGRSLGRSGVAGDVRETEAGQHRHTWSGSVTTVGSSGTNKNLQPYITCYMYKRVA